MAVSKPVFPIISQKSWWALRRRFRSSLPSSVTPGYVGSVLSITEKSAKDNIIPTLKRLGLLTAEGSPTPRAVRWRDDHQYPAVCSEIVEEVYPQELRDAVPSPSEDEQAARRWFMNRGGVGESAARQMASTYAFLSAADPSAERETRPNSSAKKARVAVNRGGSGRRAKAQTREAVATSDAPPAGGNGVAPHPTPPTSPHTPGRHSRPSLHIDLQIHIAPDASAAQIDQIFASMAKHLYGSDGS
jgi:hypothetical protein